MCLKVLRLFKEEKSQQFQFLLLFYYTFSRKLPPVRKLLQLQLVFLEAFAEKTPVFCIGKLLLLQISWWQT